jgi:DNA polymerase elongation subunit (family B)
MHQEEEGVVFTTPIGAKFVGPTVRRGVVPRLLTDLLESRRQASADIKKDDTPASVKRVLDARQKALKVSHF